ncbi:MAG: hypothetical protein ACI9KN_000293 [Gammaproteobacteria bacterium]|jgi:uncharacterized protein (DUF58 family)
MAEQHTKVQGVDVDIDDLLDVQLCLSGFSLRSFRRLASLGNQRVRVRGRGMDYEESRAYVVGDDIKAMDWRVMARTGEAHTKVFAEEKERAFMLAIDLSTSMFFGTHFGFKSWAASLVAAHIGWLASFAGECLGGLVASTNSLYSVQPVKTRAGLMSLFSCLVKSCNCALPVQAEDSQLNAVLIALRKVKAGSTLVLISDFLGIDEQTPDLLQSLVRRHEVLAVWVHDKCETDDWIPGPYAVQSNAQKFILDTSHLADARLVSQQQAKHRNGVKA